MNVTPEQIAALTDRHRIVAKHHRAPEHIKPVELELWLDNAGDLRDSLGIAIRWNDGTPAATADILDIIEPPHEFKYGDVIGDPGVPDNRAVYLPNGEADDDFAWLTHDGWGSHDWALARLADGWILNPDQQQEDATK